MTWSRLDGEMSSRVNVTPEGHGTEIEVQKVDYADAGLYECTATNSEGATSRTLRLSVECTYTLFCAYCMFLVSVLMIYSD